MKLTFLGDISLNSDYVELYEQGKDPFASLKDSLSGDRVVIGNLECLPKGEQGENLNKAPRLSTTLETLNYLENIHLGVACLAQNHIYDHLEDGFTKTLNFLDEKGIKWLGAGADLDTASRPVILQDNNTSIGLLNYVTEDTNPGLPDEAGVKLNIFKADKAQDDIQKLSRRLDHVVVILHWGGRVEGGMFPDHDQPRIARKLIDAGASLIIGHHSHTFQPYEKYKGKYIFYSLGNFCFSDFVFEGKASFMPPRRRISSMIDVSFGKGSYHVRTRFFRNRLAHFTPLKQYHLKAGFRNLLFKYFIRHKPLWNVYFFMKRKTLPLWLFMRRPDISMKEKLRRLHKSSLKRMP